MSHRALGRQFEGFPLPSDGYASHNIRVADEHGSAHAQITHDPDQDQPGTAFVDWISATPERKGYGSKLLSAMEEHGTRPIFSANGNSDGGDAFIHKYIARRGGKTEDYI